MKSSDFEKIKEAFKLVRQEKLKLEVGDKWREDVIRDVRRLATLNVEDNSFILFERFFWRFSVAGQVSLMALLLYIFQLLCVHTFTNSNFEYRMTQAFLADPVAIVLPDSMETN